MSRVVLLGDSIFDNARYVPGGPAVTAQLQERLPRGWRATLLALDGAVIADVVDIASGGATLGHGSKKSVATGAIVCADQSGTK